MNYVTLLFCAFVQAATSSNIINSNSLSLSRGWNDKVSWVPIADAYRIAKEENKPVFTLIWKSWCGSCKALKPLVAESEAFAKLASEFVMVNAGDDEEPDSEDYRIDGGYIPRLYFSDSNANVMKDVVNVGGNAKYLYYYSDVNSIIQSMKTVLNRFRYRDSLDSNGGEEDSVGKDL